MPHNNCSMLTASPQSRHDSLVSEASVGKSVGLPSDEFAALSARQKLQRVYEKRGGGQQSTMSSSPSPTSDVQKFRTSNAHLTPEQRLHTSEVRHATCKALGPSFEFDDESYYNARCFYHTLEYSHDRGWDLELDDRKPIPQKYIDEFNKRWHEDDEDHDADQYIADHVRNAAWRKHDPIHPDDKRKTGYDVLDMMHIQEYQQTPSHPACASSCPSSDHPGVIVENGLEFGPRFSSRFSWESVAEENVSHSGRRRQKLSQGGAALSPRPLKKSISGSLARKFSSGK